LLVISDLRVQRYGKKMERANFFGKKLREK